MAFYVYKGMTMDDELLKYLLVFLLVVFAFTPITINALRRRKESPPPMASQDRKLYRLWRSDPEAYERQYGEMDAHYKHVNKEKESD